MMREFPARQCKRQTLYDLVRKIDQTGSTDRLTGSGRPRSVHTAANIKNIEDLICSQERQPGTSKSPREISWETDISWSSVQIIAKRGLKLKVYRHQEFQLLLPADKEKRLNACKLLKKTVTKRKMCTWFFDEKIFYGCNAVKHSEWSAVLKSEYQTWCVTN